MKVNYLSKCFLFVGVLTCLLLLGYGSVLAAGPEKTIKLRFQDPWPITDVMNRHLDELAKNVKELSGGRLELELHTSEELMKAAEQLDAVQRGMLDISYSYGGHYMGKLPIAEIDGGLPMMWRDASELYTIMDFGLRDMLRAEYGKIGIYYLHEAPTSPYYFMVKKPVKKVDDLKSMKLRAAGSGLTLVQELGAKGMTIIAGEVYTALQLGTIDGAFYVTTGWEDLKFREVVKYLVRTEPNLSMANCHIVMNLKKWNGLPSDLRNALMLAVTNFVKKTAAEELADSRAVEIKAEKENRLLTLSDAPKFLSAAMKVWDITAAKSPQNAKAIELVRQYKKKYRMMD